jgi:hypothetical protein
MPPANPIDILDIPNMFGTMLHAPDIWTTKQNNYHAIVANL